MTRLKPIIVAIVLAAGISYGGATVMVGTNSSVLLSPSNFWSANSVITNADFLKLSNQVPAISNMVDLIISNYVHTSHVGNVKIGGTMDVIRITGHVAVDTSTWKLVYPANFFSSNGIVTNAYLDAITNQFPVISNLIGTVTGSYVKTGHVGNISIVGTVTVPRVVGHVAVDTNTWKLAYPVHFFTSNGLITNVVAGRISVIDTQKWYQAANFGTGYVLEVAVYDGLGGFHGGTNSQSSGGGALGLDSYTILGGAAGVFAHSSTGGAMGYSAVTIGGGSIGAEAKSTNGFSGGAISRSDDGGAIGYIASTINGGAVGSRATSINGGAIGSGARGGDGFAGGKNAICTNELGQAIDAIQLGSGVNATAGTMQVYSYVLMDSNGIIPISRLSLKSILPDSPTNTLGREDQRWGTLYSTSAVIDVIRATNYNTNISVNLVSRRLNDTGGNPALDWLNKTIYGVWTAQSNFVPNVSNLYTLGTQLRWWKKIYVSTGSVDFVDDAGELVASLTAQDWTSVVAKATASWDPAAAWVVANSNALDTNNILAQAITIGDTQVAQSNVVTKGTVREDIMPLGMEVFVMTPTNAPDASAYLVAASQANSTTQWEVNVAATQNEWSLRWRIPTNVISKWLTGPGEIRFTARRSGGTSVIMTPWLYILHANGNTQNVEIATSVTPATTNVTYSMAVNSFWQTNVARSATVYMSLYCESAVGSPTFIVVGGSNKLSTISVPVLKWSPLTNDIASIQYVQWTTNMLDYDIRDRGYLTFADIATTNTLDSTNGIAVNGNDRILRDADGSTAYNWTTRALYDGSGIPSIRQNPRWLLDESSYVALDWGSNVLYDTAGKPRHDWASGSVWDSDGDYSLGMNIRLLYDNNGRQNFAWSNQLWASTNIVPAVSNLHDLGSQLKPWRKLYVSTGSVEFVGEDMTASLTGSDVTNLQISATSKWDIASAWVVSNSNALDTNSLAVQSVVINGSNVMDTIAILDTGRVNKATDRMAGALYTDRTEGWAGDELVSADFVRSLFSGGVYLYNVTNVNPVNAEYYTAAHETNLTSEIRTYAAVTNNQYVGGIMSTSRYTQVNSPMTVNAYLSFNIGGGRAVTIKPELYYTYDGTNLLGDYDCGGQALSSASTNPALYTFAISFPEIMATNGAGVYIVRKFKVVSQQNNPTVTIWGNGGATPSTIGFSTPPSQDPSLGTRGATNIHVTGNLASTGTYDTANRVLSVALNETDPVFARASNDFARAASVLLSTQEIVAAIGVESNRLTNTRNNPKYVTTEESSELGSEQVATRDFITSNNKFYLHPRIEGNIIDSQWRLSVLEGASYYSLIDGYSDEFKDQSGVEVSLCSNQVWATNGWYHTVKTTLASDPYDLHFDGSDDYVSIPNSATLNVTNGYSVSMWVKAATWQDTYIMFKSADSFGLFSGGGNSAFICKRDDDAGFKLIADQAAWQGSLDMAAWHHVVCVIGAGAGTGMFVYVDSTNCSRNIGNTTASVATTNEVLIACKRSGLEHFHGSIDEITLFDKHALTDAEILDLYNSGLGKYGDMDTAPWKTNTALLLHLDEGTSTTVADSSGNANNGAFGGASEPTWEVSQVCLASGSINTNNMMLISTNLPFSFVPTSVRMSYRIEDVAGPVCVTNTDLFGYATVNNGTNWAAVSWDTDTRMSLSNRFISGMAATTNAGGSTNVRFRIDVTNTVPKNIRIHAWDGRAN